MRNPFAVPAQMFAHPPNLAFPTSRFEPSSMIEQHLEANVKLRHTRFKPVLRLLLLQNESRLLLLPKKPGGSERRSSDQHAIDSGVPHAPHDVMITVDVPIAEQQRPASSHDLRGSSDGVPIRFSSIHLLQGAAVQGDDSRLLHEKMFDPSVNDHDIVAEACLD